MVFYHDIITEQSWEMLQTLRREIDFVLIGGWAVYLYTRTLKSKDIDILVQFDQLPKLEKNYRLLRNERLKKYEARQGPVEIDIYLPHFSEIGIPVAELIGKTQMQEGFTVLRPDFLLALKLYALSQRGRSTKGKKDFLDIISLFGLPHIAAAEIKRLVDHYRLKDVWKNFQEHLQEHGELPELELNRHQFAKLKKKLKT